MNLERKGEGGIYQLKCMFFFLMVQENKTEGRGILI